MKVMGGAVLVTELLVLLLATPVFINLSQIPAGTVWIGVAIVAVLAIAAAGLIPKPVGLALGWAVQILVIASGFWAWGMFIMGAIFLGLWILALFLAQKVARIQASRENASRSS